MQTQRALLLVLLDELIETNLLKAAFTNLLFGSSKLFLETVILRRILEQKDCFFGFSNLNQVNPFWRQQFVEKNSKIFKIESLN